MWYFIKDFCGAISIVIFILTQHLFSWTGRLVKENNAFGSEQKALSKD